MLRQLKKVLEILPASDRIKLLGLLAMMFVGAFLEVLGVSTLPAFVAVVATPEKVLEVELLEPVWSTFGITTGGDLLVFGSIVLIAVFILKNAYIVFFRYVEAKFIYNRFVTIGCRLFTRYMTAPYVFSLSRNTAELLRNTNLESRTMINNVMAPTLNLVKDGIMILGIFLLLIIIEPLISLITIVLLGGTSIVFLKVLRDKMKQYGKQALEDRRMMVQSVNEGLGGLKDATVLNRESWFIDQYKKHIKSYATSQLFKTVTSKSTKPVIETIAVAGMLLIALLLYAQGRGLEVIIPILTLFGAATMRLMPSISSIVSNYNQLRYHSYSVDPIYKDLIEISFDDKKRDSSVEFEFRDVIRFSDTSYAYPNATEQAVNSITLEIEKGEAMAFVGPSGAGKTTIVDMVLGLLEPQKGEITVDGVNIYENPSGWQKHVGYIPQFIFLADSTIRRNIAFGLPDHEIDEKAILKAAESAQLLDLIDELDDGLDTKIGERGIRLSGGQRQRIGIARALYHNPSVLVMDEATSALDNVTEKFVIEAIERLKGDRTVIMIAHRLTTVRNCDMLYFMDKGRVVDQGTYQELISSNPEFKRMALVDEV